MGSRKELEKRIMYGHEEVGNSMFIDLIVLMASLYTHMSSVISNYLFLESKFCFLVKLDLGEVKLQ